MGVKKVPPQQFLGPSYTEGRRKGAVPQIPCHETLPQIDRQHCFPEHTSRCLNNPLMLLNGKSQDALLHGGFRILPSSPAVRKPAKESYGMSRWVVSGVFPAGSTRLSLPNRGSLQNSLLPYIHQTPSHLCASPGKLGYCGCARHDVTPVSSCESSGSREILKSPMNVVPEQEHLEVIGKAKSSKHAEGNSTNNALSDTSSSSQSAEKDSKSGQPMNNDRKLSQPNEKDSKSNQSTEKDRNLSLPSEKDSKLRPTSDKENKVTLPTTKRGKAECVAYGVGKQGLLQKEATPDQASTSTTRPAPTKQLPGISKESSKQTITTTSLLEKTNPNKTDQKHIAMKSHSACQRKSTKSPSELRMKPVKSLEELQLYTSSADAKVALIKVRHFDSEPVENFKAVIFHYPTSAEPLTHGQVFTACAKALKYAGEGSLISARCEPLNVILSTCGLEDRWILQLDSAIAARHLITHGLLINDRYIYIEPYNKVIRSDYSSFLQFRDVKTKKAKQDVKLDHMKIKIV